MTIKLYSKIIIFSIFLVYSIGLACNWIAGNIMQDVFDRECKKKDKIIVQLIAEQIKQKVIDNQVFLTKKVLKKIVINNKIIDYVYVVGFNNKIFTHTFKDGFPEKFSRKIHEKEYNDKSNINYFSPSKALVYDITSPIITNRPAHIHIGVNKTQLYNQITTLRIHILIICIFIIFIGIFIAGFFIQRITNPLSQLAELIHSFVKGEQEEKISFSGGCKEVTNLITSFNHIISERTKTVDFLQKNEEKYRLLVDNLSDMIVKLDTERHLVFVSPSYCKVFGKTQGELIGTKFMPRIHDEDLETARKAMSDVFKPPYFVRVEERAMTKNGWCWQEWDKTAVLDKNGKITMIMAVGRDINKRKQAELELKKSEKQYQSLFNSMSDLFYTKDMEGRFLSVNPALEKFFGYGKKELIGHKSSEFLLPELADAFEAQYIPQIKAAGYHKGVLTYLNKNGSNLYIEYNSSIVTPDKGDPFITGMGRDITEKVLWEKEAVKLQKQLVQAQKMESIGTLAGGIAHDFNNILSPMFGYLEIILYDISKENPIHDYLVEVLNGAERAKKLVKRILTFSRQSKQELKPLKIQSVVKEAMKLIKSSLPTTIKICQHIKKEPVLVLADPTQVHQIVMNLCTNAYHAMEESGGKLTVSIEEIKLSNNDLKDQAMDPGNYVCLEVSDTGIGIKKNVLDRIFDPYFTTKKEGKGTGLGLAVIHGIVKNHGGCIKVYSEHGKGTRFQVYLPIIQKSSEKIKVEEDFPIKKGRERILLIDDQNVVLDIEKKMLEYLGYKVTAITICADALNIFQANPYNFDLVITDMTMPYMTGDKISEELVKTRPDIPIIICTGFSETISEEKARSIGVKSFLMKPVSMRDLSAAICKVLNKN